MGITQFKSYKVYVFMNMVITRVKNRSPDMILMAFDGKLHETKNEIPPKACRPPKTLKKNNVGKVDTQKVEKTNNAGKEGPPSARPPERGVRGAAAPRQTLVVRLNLQTVPPRPPDLTRIKSLNKKRSHGRRTPLSMP